MRYLLFTFVALCLACSGNKKKEEVVVEFDSSINDFKASYMPEIDSSFYEVLYDSPDKPEELGRTDVEAYVSVLKELKTDGYLYNVIPEFLKIDSIKSVGEFDSYLNQMDIGQLLNSYALRIGKIDLTKDLKAELWRISYTSYDACPFYLGNDIFITFFDIKQKATSTIQVGSDYSIVDPPMAFTSEIHSYMEDSLIHITLRQQELEMGDTSEDEEIVIDEMRKTFIYNYHNGTFQK